MMLTPEIKPDTVPVMDPGVPSAEKALVTSFPFNLTDELSTDAVDGPVTLTKTLLPSLINSGSGVLRLWMVNGAPGEAIFSPLNANPAPNNPINNTAIKVN